MGHGDRCGKVRIVPLLAEVLAEVFGALLIDGAHPLLGIDALVEAMAKALNTLLARGIDEDMADVGLVLENALGAAANDDAVALGISLLDDFARNLDGFLGVENGVVAQFEAGGQSGRAHGLLIDAAQPRDDVLVVVAHHAGIDVRLVGDGVDDVFVEQLPTQPTSNGFRNAPAA